MIDCDRILSAKMAIDNMDDYAKMSTSINPIGARTYLETFVADVETTVPELVGALKDLLYAFESSIPGFCDVANYEEYQRAVAIIAKTTGAKIGQ